MTVLSLIPLLACSGGTLMIGDDTGSVATAGDTGATSDSGGTSDTEDTEDTIPPEPVPDISVWNADLVYNYDTWGSDYDCIDEFITETSTPPTVAEIAALAAECPACTAFYRTYPSVPQICGWLDLPEEELRGLVLSDGWAQVYQFQGSLEDGYSSELLDSAATYDGWIVNFSAVLSVWWTDLEVVGTVTFPEMWLEDSDE